MERKVISKKAFDAEYPTQWLREVDFLRQKDIFPAYVHNNEKTGISTYKYTKTPELFLALIEYYTMIRYEEKMKAEMEALQPAKDTFQKPKIVPMDDIRNHQVAKKVGEKKPFKPQKFEQITIDEVLSSGDTDGDDTISFEKAMEVIRNAGYEPTFAESNENNSKIVNLSGAELDNIKPADVTGSKVAGSIGMTPNVWTGTESRYSDEDVTE